MATAVKTKEATPEATVVNSNAATGVQDVIKYASRKIKINEVNAKYQLKVLSIGETTDDQGRLKKIVNFNAYTPFHETEMVRLCEEGDFVKASNQNVSWSYVVGAYRGYVPTQGETVNVLMQEVDTKNATGAWLAQEVTPIANASNQSVGSLTQLMNLAGEATSEEKTIDELQ